MVEAGTVWANCSRVLKDQISAAVWQSTFNPVRALTLDETTLTLGVPSPWARDRLVHRFNSLILDALAEVGHPDLDIHAVVEIPTDNGQLVDPLAEPHVDDIGPTEPESTIDLRDGSAATSPSTEIPDHAPRVERAADPRRSTDPNQQRFDSFVIGASNRFAQAAALSVAETPGRAYNPLFIYGSAGLGKTHLLKAIGLFVNDNYPTYKVQYVSAEEMMNQFVEAIRSNTQDLFKQRFRQPDVLLVDDIQFIEKKEGLQEEFFHTFNHLQEAGRQIVLSSDRPPDNIPTLEDRLRSRFKMGLITDIQPPDLETRLAILGQKISRDNLHVPHEVSVFIAENITNNIRELEGALNRVTAYARLNQTELTLEVAERTLADVTLDKRPRVITAELILTHVCEKFAYSREELEGKSRRRPLVTARQIAMYVMRELTDLSYPAIAREFGGRDHTTVMHAVDKIKNQMGERQQVYDQVTEIITEVRTGEKP